MNPSCLAGDDLKPAVFLARKLFCDYVQLSGLKIEAILAQEAESKPTLKPLLKHEDPIYDRILEAIGSISEFCLPSLLESLLQWYHHQLVDDESQPSKRLSCETSSQHPSFHQMSSDFHQSSLDCGSPCGQRSSFLASELGNSLTVRSPTPSSPDTTINQISVTSTLPLDYQSPSITIVNEQHHSSTANTSNSTATNLSSNSLTGEELSKNTSKRLELAKTRKLLIECVFCQALIEIFSQLDLHPGHEHLISQILDISFNHFKYVESSQLSPSSSVNTNQLIDKYAEVLGVLAQTRFKLVRRRFMNELNDLRAKESTSFNILCIVSLLASMKYFRIKMAPIEEFEASFQFLHELAEYFIEVRHKSIKHALANLFVEILVPLSVIVKNEVKIPCLKNFVDMLWPQTLEMSTRKKHSVVLFPLNTCLLCASQRSFFLSCWSGFLNMCLSNLKNRDQKMCRVALESLYRLIWIYMVRIKCESNNVTQNRLHSIVDAIFPRNNRSVTPRDAPLSIFVDIIHFIAQERLDFAMRHIIFDLLSVDRPQKVIVAPERMNIALQAFLVIADNLQQKEGEPSMPITLGTPRPRRSHINKMLNNDMAKQLGIAQYFPHIQRSFNEILKALDTQLGRPLSLTINLNFNKEPEDVITNDRKPKIDLFKTCIAAIPRIMPEGMSRTDLIDLLARMTVHVDGEIRKLAFESLQILISDFPDWRLECIEGFTLFLANQIDESMRVLVDKALGMLLQLLISWHSAITCSTPTSTGCERTGTAATPVTNQVSIQTGYETISSRSGTTGGQIAARKNRALAEMRLIQSELSNTRFERLVSVIQRVEGASLVMSCSCHQPTRRLATHLMRECRAIVKCYTSWICMEQFGLRSPEEVEEEDLSASLRGSLSADNLSRITTTSANGPTHCSVTSMNTQTVLSTSISRMYLASISADSSNQQQQPCSIGGQMAAESASHRTSGSQQAQLQHDPYDSDLENNLADCLTKSDQNSTLIFWIALILLESDNEQENLLALRLLKKILPNLPFEQPDFIEERGLTNMNWENFQGIHALVMKCCVSSITYEISISLLDSLTPLLKFPLCTGLKGECRKSETFFPFHVIALMTYLLSNYDDPSPLSLNIARRIAIWCDESSLKGLENLSTVMNLYSRRSFSKDGFQWTKCVVKYLNDVYKDTLPKVIPMLVDMLERGPLRVQRLVAPILYCILNYVDISGGGGGGSVGANADTQDTKRPDLDLVHEISRVYSKYLSDMSLNQWRDGVQIFKLLISRSSQLSTQGGVRGCELPGRTMDFSVDVDSMLIIAKEKEE